MKFLAKVFVGLGFIFLFFLIGAVALYIFGGNWAVNSGFLENLLSRHPERFKIEWESGKFSMPGTFRLEGLAIKSRSAGRETLIKADKCELKIKPLKLFLCKADFRDARAEGFTLWTRRNGEAGARDPLAPPITENAGNTGHHGGGGKIASPWSLSFGKLKINEIREIWIDSYRTNGVCSAEGNFYFRIRGAMEARDVRFSLKDATMRKGAETIASGLGLDIDGSIDRVIPAKHKGRAFLRFVNARCKGKGDVRSLGFLNQAFGDNAPVRFTGNGNLLMDVSIAQGVIGPGSSLSWSGKGLTGSSAGVSAKGDGALSGGTGAGGTAFSLTAKWSKIVVSLEGIPPIPIEGPGLTAVVTTPRLDLASDNDDLAAKLDLPESRISNLSLLNGLLPPQSPVAFSPGSEGRLRANLELKDKDPRGEAYIEGTRVGISLKQQSLRGDFHALLRLSGGDLKAKTFDISGSKFGLGNADLTNSSGQVTDRGWKGDVALSESSLRLSVPAAIKTKAEVTLSDTRPVMAALIPENKMSKWLDPILDIPDVRGTAEIETDGKRTTVRNADLRGRDLRLIADLTMYEGLTEGTMRAEYHGLSGTIAFKGRDVELNMGGLKVGGDIGTLGKIVTDVVTDDANVDKAVGAAKKGLDKLKKRFGKKEKEGENK
mgnify:CR=1 FL=1